MNMKHYKPLAWMMAIAIATLSLPMTACSNDDETAPDSRQPEPTAELCVYGVQHTATRGSAAGAVFTDDDIEWFDLNTRELRFRDMEEPLYEKLRLLSSVEFRLDDQTLFSCSTFVGLICSQVFNDLVLCCGKIEDGRVIDSNRYYLYDCYPNTPQFLNDEQVKANRAKRAAQWETFTKYLESKGKLKK